jgi:hypothetical protein
MNGRYPGLPQRVWVAQDQGTGGLGASAAAAGLTIWGLLHRLTEHENLSRRTKVTQHPIHTS